MNDLNMENFMLVCSDAIIDGLKLSELKFSGDAIFSMQANNISMFLMFNRLRNGKFKLIRKKAIGIWELRSKSISIIVEYFNKTISAVFITEFQEGAVKNKSIGDLIPNRLISKIKMDAMVKSATLNCNEYIEDYLFLNHIKIKGVTNERK